MWVTSAAKVTVPGIFDLLNVRFDYGPRLPQLHLREANVNRQLYRRRQPEFRLPVRVCDMNMIRVSSREKRTIGTGRLGRLWVTSTECTGVVLLCGL